MDVATLGEEAPPDGTAERDRQLLSLYIKCTERDAPVASRHTKVWSDSIQHCPETTSSAIATTDRW
jgi:hypothetical protein